MCLGWMGRGVEFSVDGERLGIWVGCGRDGEFQLVREGEFWEGWVCLSWMGAWGVSVVWGGIGRVSFNAQTAVFSLINKCPKPPNMGNMFRYDHGELGHKF